jgi:glyoxylase I family protein
VDLEIVGLDHIYITVSDFERSESFYDRVMERLGFKKGDGKIAGDPHAHYFNRALQLSIRPAKAHQPHDPYAPGLHHICLQVASAEAVDQAAIALAELGVEATAPAFYPQYADDYYATFFTDPDGIRLELVARRAMRREVVEKWDRLEGFLNPMRRLKDREGST